jgi:hypothetical protein
MVESVVHAKVTIQSSVPAAGLLLGIVRSSGARKVKAWLRFNLPLQLVRRQELPTRA